jgi:Ca-activated chloride channel family protein
MELGKPYMMIVGVILLVSYMLRMVQLGKKAEVTLPQNKNTTGKNKYSFYHFFSIISMVGILFITYSLGQPRKSLGHVNNNIEVNDIFLVVDVSRSMLAEDFPPNRLIAARKQIRDFVKLRPTDRIGIIMFSEKAFTLLPLSTDLKLIEQSVDDLKVGFLGGGTNIGDALALAVGRATQSIAKNKVIILLTDGVSTMGTMSPIRAAEEAKKINVKVYTIGIGKKKNSKKLRLGAGYQLMPGGSVDLKTLDEISKITGGKSFYAGNEKALTEVLSEIQKLEKTKIKTSGRVIYKEYFWEYLLVGLILYLFGDAVLRFRYGELL